MENTYSNVVKPTMSPYPIVAKTVDAQYKAAR